MLLYATVIHRSIVLRCIVILPILLNLGCNERLVHDLTEHEVNRVVSTLHQGGIDAKKVRQTDGRWAVEVSRSELVSALTRLDSTRILARRDLGADRKSASGLIPSREEQWLVYESKMATTLEGTLLTVPGVLDAHVHLHLPKGDPLLGTRTTESGSGSVLLLTDSSFLVPESDIAAMIGGGAGVPPERVRVLRSSATSTGLREAVFHPDVTSSIGPSPQRTSSAQLRDLAPSSEDLALVLGAVITAGSIGYLLCRRRRKMKIFNLSPRVGELGSENV
jgi:type III secretory pathway lipoprotein EscJ